MIDYEKLKEAHELAEKYSIMSDNVLNVSLHFMNGGCSYWLTGSAVDDEFDSLDDIIAELKELTKPEPKYKVGQLVWHNTEEDLPERFVIRSISQDQNGNYGYHEGLDYESQSKAWLEDCLYPSRQALIDAQIAMWQALKVDNNETKSCQSRDAECEHESVEDHEILFKCIKCGEFYR